MRSVKSYLSSKMSSYFETAIIWGSLTSHVKERHGKRSTWWAPLFLNSWSGFRHVRTEAFSSLGNCLSPTVWGVPSENYQTRLMLFPLRPREGWAETVPGSQWRGICGCPSGRRCPGFLKSAKPLSSSDGIPWRVLSPSGSESESSSRPSSRLGSQGKRLYSSYLFLNFRRPCFLCQSFHLLG